MAGTVLRNLGGRRTRKSGLRPFLKWAGGKRQLLPELLARVDAAGDFGRYHEPFLGGGALFFEMARSGRLRRQAWLSDNNPNLIEAYAGIKQDVEGVLKLLRHHWLKHEDAYYYEMRAAAPKTLVGRAARVIYLNRTCFNGLYRENSRGVFNVPVGRYVNPTIYDKENLLAVAEALNKARVEARHFATVLTAAKPGDFVYFDPPYQPVSVTASFTSYDKNGFGEDAQRELAEVARELDRKGVKVLLSNSYTPLVRQLYRAFPIDEVFARRMVNSRADRRGKVSEALVRNFELPGGAPRRD